MKKNLTFLDKARRKTMYSQFKEYCRRQNLVTEKVGTYASIFACRSMPIMRASSQAR